MTSNKMVISSGFAHVYERCSLEGYGRGTSCGPDWCLFELRKHFFKSNNLDLNRRSGMCLVFALVHEQGAQLVNSAGDGF